MTSVRCTYFFAAFLIFAAWSGLSNSVQAQGTGKITATIVDGKTGEKLVRASVQILETKQGAYTKDNGVGTIINVAPNENYTVVAKYAGYKPSTLKHVKVQSDITTALKFSLSTTTADTTLVVADKYMVEKSNTQVSTKWSTTQIVNVPGRQRIDEIIRLTPGVVTDAANGGLSINGEKGTGNSMRLNGTETADIVSGRTSALQNSLSKFAISEINVITAGGDASHGGYSGGEVNTTTRAGGNNLEVNLHYRQEIPPLFGYSENGYQQQPAGDRILELAVGGPITDEIKYFITGKVNSFDHYNVYVSPVFSNAGLGVFDPVGNNLGQLPHTGWDRRSFTGKLSFNLLGFSMSADALLGAENTEFNDWSTLYMDPYQLLGRNELNNIYELTGRGQIGEGLLELSGSYEITNRQDGKYDQSQPLSLFRLFKFYNTGDNYTYNDNTKTVTPGADGVVDIYTPATRQIPDPANPTQPYATTVYGLNPFTGHIEGPPITLSSANPYGLVNAFVVAGNLGGFSSFSSHQTQLDAKYTQQVGAHLLNGGFEAKLYQITNASNGLPWDPNPFQDNFSVKPFTAAAYIVDKMEFSDITFNPSLRFDIYNPDAPIITNLYDPLSAPLGKAPMQTQLSPRLGITYAVTDQTTFNFDYNWYFKQPLLEDVLASTGGDFASALRRGNQTFGSGGLLAEKTKEIAVGFNTQLSDVVAITVQGIYKDLRNHAGLQQVSSPYLPVGYSIFSSDQYGSYRGIQLTFEKRMSDNYSVRFNYTLSNTVGTSSSATENYSQLINQDPNSEQAVLPLQPFTLSYDKPHVGQLLLNVNYNKGEGPTIFGTKLLQWFSLSTTTEYQSGVPYTRVDLKGRQIGEYNGDREPSYFETDANLTRTIPFGELFGEAYNSLFMDLTLEVLNVFNRTSALQVFATTGQGDNNGQPGTWPGNQEYYNDPTNSLAPSFGQQVDGFGKLFYNPRIDLNHDGKVSLDEQQQAYTRLRADQFARHVNYQVPRRFFFNVSLRF